jgi:hypothetical protein
MNICDREAGVVGAGQESQSHAVSTAKRINILDGSRFSCRICLAVNNETTQAWWTAARQPQAEAEGHRCG